MAHLVVINLAIEQSVRLARTRRSSSRDLRCLELMNSIPKPRECRATELLSIANYVVVPECVSVLLG